MDRLNLDIEFKTFGCKVNTYDTGLLQKRLKGAEAEARGGEQKVFVLNSCAVTSEATKQVIREARKLKRENPLSKVVVTGCSAQVDTDQLVLQNEIDLIVANSHKGEIANIIESSFSRTSVPRVYKSNIFAKEDLEAGGGEEANHTRSFLKIQDGCNSFCTFCVIPFARGKSRSIPVNDLIKKIHELERQQVLEVVLTGVHIGDYEEASGLNLEHLVQTVLRETSIPRIRLSSLEPIELSEGLLELFDDPRMCQHFHMSIQSGSTSILQKMKRKYGADDVRSSFERINKKLPMAYVGMDVIAGFPEESEAEFAQTYQLLSETPWTRMHVFPYSDRPLTYAARALSKVDPAVVRARALRLRELSQERLMKEALAQVGTNKKCLILGSGKTLSRDYWTVLCDWQDLPGDQNWVGHEIEVKITGCDRELNRQGEVQLYGEVGSIFAQ